MSDDERSEIINAARSYERIVAARHQLFLVATQGADEENRDEVTEARRQFHARQKDMIAAEKLLAERIYGVRDFTRVDDVIYKSYSATSLLRIQIQDIPNLANTPDLVLL